MQPTKLYTVIFDTVNIPTIEQYRLKLLQPSSWAPTGTCHEVTEGRGVTALYDSKPYCIEIAIDFE